MEEDCTSNGSNMEIFVVAAAGVAAPELERAAISSRHCSNLKTHSKVVASRRRWRRGQAARRCSCPFLSRGRCLVGPGAGLRSGFGRHFPPSEVRGAADSTCYRQITTSSMPHIIIII